MWNRVLRLFTDTRGVGVDGLDRDLELKATSYAPLRHLCLFSSEETFGVGQDRTCKDHKNNIEQATQIRKGIERGGYED